MTLPLKMDDNIAIFVAIIFIIALVVLWVGSIMYQNPTINPVTTEASRQCLPGQCAANIYNGVKRCPANETEIINAKLATEVCSAPFTCDNTALPVAIDTRGVALAGSECPANQVCQCLSGQYCGPDIMGYFQPYTASQYILTKYQQVTRVTDQLGKVHYSPPYYIPRGKGSCTISPELFQQNALDVSSCLFGTMAYFPATGATVDGQTTPLACVRGKPCSGGLSAVYDPVTRKIICRLINNSVIAS